MGCAATGKECPDLLPTLAALACVLPRPTTLSDVGILRVKESDRLEGIRTLVAAYGGTTELSAGATRRSAIHPPKALPRASPWTAEATTGWRCRRPPCACCPGRPWMLTGPECVEKSFPGFWRQLERAGVRYSEREKDRITVAATDLSFFFVESVCAL